MSVPRPLTAAHRLATSLDQLPGVGGRHWPSPRDADLTDRADALRALASVHDLDLAPLDVVGGAAAWQHDPSVAELRSRLERDYEHSLDRWSEPLVDALPSDPVEAVRALSAIDRIPAVYDWAAERATLREVVQFLSLEGGPDDAFDDLVAICQVGLPVVAKLELARNYWDEMGNGHLGGVHRQLHQRLVAATGITGVPRQEMSEAALARSVLGGFLATNRRLQPEMVGALGMVELQAGPRCRRVVRALHRVGAPGDAVPFYEEHAVADPRHGKDWLDNAIIPLAELGWGPGMVRGAAWRAAVNRRFFDELAARFEI